MEPICISSQKPGWWSLTEADKHRWGGKKQWAELCWKRIIQKTHRIPLLINTPLSVEGPTRDKLGTVAFLMTLVTHRRRSAEVQRCVILALWVCFFFSWVVLFFSLGFWLCFVLFFSCCSGASSRYIWRCWQVSFSGVDNWALEVKGMLLAEDILDVSFAAVHHCCGTPTLALRDSTRVTDLSVC